MAAARWVGRGDKNGADGAAVNAMRCMIGSVGMRGMVVIGEGEKDNAPMLYNGEEVGDGTGPECDVAVDPIDGTTLTAKGMNNAVAVMAVAPRRTMFDPSAVFYMEKLVTGPEAADVVDIRKPVAENIRRRGQGQGHARARRHGDPARPPAPPGPGRGDPRRPAPASSTSSTATSPARSWPPVPTPASTCCSASAARPEGIIAACAMKCMGGVIQGRLWPTDDDERQKALDAGHDLDPDTILTTDAAGHRRGLLLRGHRHHRRRAAQGRALPRRTAPPRTPW